jgi:hypothetical protein
MERTPRPKASLLPHIPSLRGPLIGTSTMGDHSKPSDQRCECTNAYLTAFRENSCCGQSITGLVLSADGGMLSQDLTASTFLGYSQYIITLIIFWILTKYPILSTFVSS